MYRMMGVFNIKGGWGVSGGFNIRGRGILTGGIWMRILQGL